MFNQKGIKAVLNLILFIACAGGAWAQSKVGTTAAPFLGIAVGPRALAMGGAFTAMGDDATGLYYNPGSITFSGKTQIMESYTKWLIDTDFNWIGVVIAIGGVNAIGISVTTLAYGEEEVTTVLEPEGTGEFWNAMDMALGLTYCRSLTDRFSIGGTVKYIRQAIWNENASAIAADIGLLFVTPFKDIRLGMSISNFGSDMKMEGKDLWHQIDLDPEAIGNNETIVSNLKTDPWPLPLFFRVGLSMDVIKLKNNRLTLALDALRPSDNTEALNVGGEYGLMNMFFLRAGYKSLFRKESVEGLTFGFGVRIKTGTIEWNLDWAYAQMDLFKDVLLGSLRVSF